MNSRNLNIIIIFLLCCAICSGREVNAVEKSDPDEPLKEQIGYRAGKDETRGLYLYTPIYEDGSEGQSEKYTPKGKHVFNSQSYFLSTGLKRKSWFIGPEIYHFKYKESDIQDKGTFYGMFFSCIYRDWITEAGIENPLEDKRMYGAEFRFAFGEVDYDGQLMDGTPYRISNIDERTFEVRFLFGPDSLNESDLSTLYTGLGYRYLFDDSSFDPAGYERTSNYLYLPFGYKFNQITDDPWSMAATVEADLLILGIQKSDFGTFEVDNNQRSGMGYRASVKFQNKSDDGIFIIEPFFRYWDIEKSDVEYIFPYYYYEPANETTEFGIQLKWLF